MFPRPEPYSLSVDTGPNPPEKGGKMGGVGWQRPDYLSRWAKHQVVAYLQKRVDELAVQSRADSVSKEDLDSDYSDLEDDVSAPHSNLPLVLKLQPNDALEPVTILKPSTNCPDSEELVITYASPRFFVDLLAYPTPSLALLVGGETEGRWKVSSSAQFSRLFERASSGPRLPFSGPPPSSSFVCRSLAKLRLARLTWALSFIPAHERLSRSKRVSWLGPPYYLPIDLNGFHPHGFGDGNLVELIIVMLATVEDRVAYFLSWLFRVRYAVGVAPWEDWTRAVLGQERKKKVGC